jgi:hypothetical protein
MIVPLEQGMLNYFGRVIYNYHRNIFKQNIFRENNLLSRAMTLPCKHISKAITYKSYIDRSLINELDIYSLNNKKTNKKEIKDILQYATGERKAAIRNLHNEEEAWIISNYTYAQSFNMQSMCSNIEYHYFSKYGNHVAYMKELTAYDSMDYYYNHFNNIDVQELKEFFKGSQKEWSHQQEAGISQIITFFLCETSRNPATFFTFPMCLEIAEYISKNEAEELQIMDHLLNNAYFINKKDVHQKEDIVFSDIVKAIITNFYPVSIEKAVSGCRTISEAVNTAIKNNNLEHNYDYSTGNISEARKLLTIELSLLWAYQWIMYNKNTLSPNIANIDVYTKIAKDWYGIIVDTNNIFIKMEDNFRSIQKSLNTIVEKSKDYQSMSEKVVNSELDV